jgi:hypothetical protein
MNFSEELVYSKTASAHGNYKYLKIVPVGWVRIFSGAGLDVQWSGGSYLGVQWSGHVRRGFGGADDVAKRLTD